mgnify:CR=1 FL=1
MQKKIWAGIAGLAMLGAGAAQAAEGDILARARVINIAPAASGSSLNLDVKSATTLELDFTYFFTKNIAAELILGTKTHDVTLNGAKIGTVKHLPPTVTVQYHFQPDAELRPYVGAGLNYTRFSNVNLLAGAATVDKSSWGPAVQAGLDYSLTKTVFLNLDVKYIKMDTDVKATATGALLSNLKINPWIYGIGLGMKF